MTAPSAAPSASVLYLEDDEDIRELLSDLLRDAGYEVTPQGTAEDALQAMGRRRYDLLLTDFRLPNKNADWLLAEAEGAGLLEHTAVIILTGEQDPPGLGGHQILRKPIDVALLLGHIARSITRNVAKSAGRGETPAAPTTTTVPEPRVALRLYVSASLESMNAERHLRALLATTDKVSGRLLEELVTLTVFDVTTTSSAMFEAIEEDHVIVTPTIVRRAPGVRASFLGDLSRRGVVETMLREALEASSERQARPDTDRRPSRPNRA